MKADALHVADATDTYSRQVRKRNRREIRDERIIIIAVGSALVNNVVLEPVPRYLSFPWCFQED